MGHERSRLSAFDRHTDIQPIKRAQEAVKDSQPTFLETGLEHRVVKGRIPRLGPSRSSLLVRIEQFLDARVCALKVARSANRTDLRSQTRGKRLERFVERRNRRVRS
jgi:hypothetical protein